MPEKMRNRGFRATFAAILLATGLAAADEGESTLRDHARGWRGTVEIETRLKKSGDLSGEEIQTERVEFFAVTDPKRRGVDENVLPLRLGRSKGRWKIKIDLREPRGAGEVATKGAASGDLNFTLEGAVDTRTGLVHLRFGTRSQRLSTQTTMSGMDTDGFATFRNVAVRRSVLEGIREKGKLDEAQRKASGEREFEVKRGKYVRTARVRWSLERLEPEVRGRIVDQHGAPVEGLKVIARTLKPAGPGYPATTVQLEAMSDKHGCFRIPADFGTWGVEIQGRVAKGVLTRGWVKSDAARLRFDKIPELEVTAVTYVFARLPMSRLLATRFRDNVNQYMDYIERRYAKRGLANARVPKAP